MTVVKFSNDINNISLKGLTAKEINIFFAILFKAQNLNSLKVTMSCSELRNLSCGEYHCDRFAKSIENTFRKLMNVNSEFENYQTQSISCVFTDLSFNKKNSTLTIIINPNICWFPKTKDDPFTFFRLKDLNSVKGVYAKNMFRLLQQFKGSTFFKIYLNKFKHLLGIPASYSISKIDQRVLQPILKELSRFYRGLKIEKIKKGKSVFRLDFTWSSYIGFKGLKCQNRSKTPTKGEKPQNSEIRAFRTEFETKKAKLFLKLIKFISNIKEFDNLHHILHKIQTEDELNNFKLEYNL